MFGCADIIVAQHTSGEERVLPATLEERIKRLAGERRAVLLAHNYQDGNVQDLADFVGDSLELSIRASRTEAEVIVLDRSYGSVVFREGNPVEYLLVLHVGGGHWDIPKGHPDAGEGPRETALREVLEETNSVVEILPGFEESIEYVLPEGEPKRVTFFLSEFAGEGSTRSNPTEIADLCWLPYEQALHRMTYESARSVLKKAQAFLDSRASR